jgi:SagB-type dehydrogenase family enzyme
MEKDPLTWRSLLASVLFIFWISACRPEIRQDGIMENSQPTPSKVKQTGEIAPQQIQLPTPKLKGTLSLEETLAKRRSVREFTGIPLRLEELGQLLWAVQGINDPAGYRTAPSAGALYPLEVYLVTSQGLYHYEPVEHRLILQEQGDLRSALYQVTLQQDMVLEAPAVFLIAAEYGRTEVKYGKERSPRYVHLEAGHAAQNLLLQAVALDLGAVPVGAFDDEGVKDMLSLPKSYQPIYLIPVGHPK